MSDQKTAPRSVGEELQSRREALKLSLAQVELATKIRGKYLIAIEGDQFDRLPNDIYSRGFVQRYADHLGLDSEAIVGRYLTERGGLAAAQTRSPRLTDAPRLVLTGRLVAIAGVLLSILAIGGYLLWQFTDLAAPPTVALTSPGSDQTITGSLVTVSGRVTPGADVTIDGVAVVSRSDGTFSSPVSLQEGLNTIRVAAKSRLGKQTVVSRSLLARLPAQSPVKPSVPTAPFNGVAVVVTVSRNVGVSVSVDGRTTRQIMLAGTSQLFQGASDINLTTSDAGATAVTVTNSVVAAKSIPRLGADGELRVNQDFTATTVIP